jgi:hypothetical protein
MEDDVFRGYFIPKDTMVLANIWYATNVTEEEAS